MKPIPLLPFACAVLALAAGTARAEPRFGVTEDAAKYDDDGGKAVHVALDDLGMTEVRIWVFWDAARPTEIVERAFLDRSLPVAALHGTRVTFSVSPLKARAIAGSSRREAEYVAFLEKLARTYPYVRRFVIGNEPNQPRFWQPQFIRGKPVAGATYYRLLARAYDTLKAIDPGITVIGVGLSPRGNDRPNARSNRSTSPVRFLHDLGVAYRRSGRQKPIMDTLGFHPYPRFDRDPLTRGYAWPNAGMTNLARIKQAVWDAFNGTAQPTFAEEGEEPSEEHEPQPLTLTLDEVGWQVQIPRASRPAYTGRESVRGTNEAQQARIYSQVVDIAACDPSVESLHFFHLIDERDLDRFQSGLIRADWTRRPSYFAVKSRLTQLQTGDGVVCPGRPVRWKHATSVIGATADFSGRGGPGFGLRATEEATYVAGLFPVSSLEFLEEPEEAAIEWLLETSRLGLGGLPSASGKLRANARRQVQFRLSPEQARPGNWVYAVRLAATMNPERTTFLMSEPFRLG